ncbi:hypothetical protein [Desertivirga arenae]|uniref:hypothetical protein n=1 Tax=Desertivirga arenae TaxID=2810309 RepID=UPI001A95BA21|nr:hypothetical protein [Pedobacter sp. SYSU D00823]
MESSLGLKLPSTYEVIKSRNEGFGPDFMIELEIKLEDSGKEDVIHQIKGWKNLLSSSEINQYMKSPILRGDRDTMGYWIYEKGKYIYKEPFLNSEPVQCEINADGLISFRFVHL